MTPCACRAGCDGGHFAIPHPSPGPVRPQPEMGTTGGDRWLAGASPERRRVLHSRCLRAGDRGGTGAPRCARRRPRQPHTVRCVPSSARRANPVGHCGSPGTCRPRPTLRSAFVSPSGSAPCGRARRHVRHRSGRCVSLVGDSGSASLHCHVRSWPPPRLDGYLVAGVPLASSPATSGRPRLAVQSVFHNRTARAP